jgi:hypothetical protein
MVYLKCNNTFTTSNMYVLCQGILVHYFAIAAIPSVVLRISLNCRILMSVVAVISYSGITKVALL